MKAIIFFDLESTGTDIANDRIVQFAALKIIPNEELQLSTNPPTTGFWKEGNYKTEELKFLINPGIPIPAEVSAIHGITDADVAQMPRFKEVANQIHQFMLGSDLSGFNLLRFDIPLIAEEFGRAGIKFTLQGVNVVDPFILYKILYPQSLSAAYNKYTGKELEGAHDAMNDVVASFKVLQGMVEQNHVPENMEDLLKFQANGKEFDSTVDFAGKFIRNEAGDIILNFGKHKGCRAIDELGFVAWMLGKDFTSDTLSWCERIVSGKAGTKVIEDGNALFDKAKTKKEEPEDDLPW